ncbi:Hypothetical predicted protein [Olea europaea subsp. europaea]|uniref:Uncharacterized protein n=2 Tax=Olea europaea subsp. europaea TaxID=158383 RepID=A0A8S0SR24_OLEEU|nr:Hypothetical predicted protein [Olea europaea subsp. europaea]
MKFFPSYLLAASLFRVHHRPVDSRANAQQTCMMGSNSKVLLDLEANNNTTNFSTSCLESKLQFCGTDDVLLQSGATKINPPQQKPTICPLPKSNVLGKVKDFLGVLSESNRNMMQEAKDNPENYDIEVLSGRESEYIEMDLMLGIADLHTPEAVAAAESAIAGYQPIIPLAGDSSSGSESEDSSDDDDDNNVEDDKEEHSAKFSSEANEKDSSKAPRNQKSRKRPNIVEIS